MKNFKIMLLLIIFLIVLFIAPVNGVNQKSLVVINFNYQVDPGAQDYFQSVYNFAVENGDPVLIIMNTPGGYLDNAFAIVNYTVGAEKYVNFTTYVPPGDMAASAGSYIAMASDNIYMGNGSFIGPSKPYIIGGTALEEQHVTNASLAYMESLAQMHGKNMSAVYAMVENNTAYTAKEALSLGVINGMTDNLTSLLIKLNYQSLPKIEFYETSLQQFESFISNSTVVTFFILIGAVAILLDIYHGSIILSIAGVISLAIGFWGSGLITYQPVSYLLIIIGIVMVFLEIKLGHGLAMVSGVALVIAGSLMMMIGVTYSSNLPYLNSSNYALIAFEATVIPIGALYLIGLRKSVMKKPPKVGVDRYVGKRGKAVTDLSPGKEGVVNVLSEEWSAKSEEVIKKGEEIEVIKYENGILIVRKVS
ncbi:MAG: NfeD family protein [Thermoplasmata archaeon]